MSFMTYSSLNIWRIIKSKKSLVGYEAHVTEITNSYKFWPINKKGKGY
jgi:hypothetical protein